ncbi:MAG: phosphate signaling complex protein PhoU [Burkholderiales bacterium]
MSHEIITTTTEIELEALSYRILGMGELVDTQVRDAVKAFATGDLSLAEAVIRKEADVNAMELRLDNECAELIAKRQPAAIDLRRVLSASKVVGNLEQVGDHAKKIAKYTIALNDFSVIQSRKVAEIWSLADASLQHLRDALGAYSQRNAAAAQAVIDREQGLDDRYQGIARQVLSFAMEDPRLISWSLLVSAAAKAAERVGHQGTNIAQHAIYAAEARDVRHKGLGRSANEAAAAS